MADKSAPLPQPSRPAPVEPVLRVVPLRPLERAGGRQPVMERPAARASRASSRERSRLGRRRRHGGTSSRSFGEKLSIGISSLQDYAPDNDLSDDESLSRFYSSSDKENVIPGRKRLLDDALFRFFRKEAINSRKTEFSKFCNSSVIWNKNELSKGHLAGREDFIAYSVKYFSVVLNSMSTRRRNVIRKFGFGCLLLFDKVDIPSVFVRWLTSCVDHVSSQIIVDGSKILPISKEFVHHVLGLPNKGSIPMADSDSGSKFVLSMFGLKELPHITFFGNKLKSKEVLTDKEVFVCFMVVAFKCFLFPTMDDYPNTDFLSMLEDPSSANGVDLCMLVYEHLISGASKFNMFCKFNGRKPKHFELCYYALSVYYLDSLDFGARNLDQSLPRVSVWKGNLIRFFSDLDYKKNNLYGKRQLKKNLPHCYRVCLVEL